MDRINEQCSAYYTCSFYDMDGALEAPTSCSYSIWDKESGAAIRSDTALTPGSSVIVHLEPSDTTMQDATKKHEVHLLTMIGIYGVSDQVTMEIEFQVDSLVGIT